jgi:hypothetical protein
MKPDEPKKPSGAAFRKQRRQRDAEARADEAARRAASGAGPPPHLVAFANLGPTPEDAALGLVWSARAGRELLRSVLLDPVITEDKRRAQATALLKALGTLIPREAYEQRIEALRRKIYGYRDPPDGLEPYPTLEDHEPVELEKESP